MKIFIPALLLLLSATILFSQEIPTEIRINNQAPFLIGKIQPKDLTSNSYQSWYNTNYKTYKIKTSRITVLKEELSQYHILVFMGTWCGDSKREVPRFLKILEMANFPMQNLKIVALDKRRSHYKKSPTGEEWGLQIKRVPTFIFYKNGKEINRIVERPLVSLEDDMKTIISKQSYIPNYSKSLHFD